jgi:predicted nucleotidyltransferase
MKIAAELPLLSDTERSCLERYVALLAEALGDALRHVYVYGSVAREESWPAGMPIRSDLDLLVVTERAVPEDVVEALVDATLPLFLEAGRQLGPVFRTVDELEHPRTERSAEFLEQFRRDAILVFSRGAMSSAARLAQPARTPAASRFLRQ